MVHLLPFLRRTWFWVFIILPKAVTSIPEHLVKGEGMTFYSPEEVIIAYNERKVDLHAYIKVSIEVPEDGSM
jgi:hypothetical protein